MSLPTTDNNIFEGLFSKLLQPQGAFKVDLRAAGYDVDNPELRYPTAIWMACIDVAARHVYPELSREDAHRKLGQRFADRYLTTILGRIVRTLVFALGVDKFIMQLPKVVALSSTGLIADSKKLDVPGEYSIVFRGESQSPDFIAGAFEGGAQDVSIYKLKAEVARREPAEFELKISGLAR